MSEVKIKSMLRQLLREFWLPGLLAFCWTGYSIWQGEIKGVYGFIQTFGPAFFLASWATAQYFRIAKQTRVESDLTNLQNQTKELIKSLDSAATRLSDLATGGKSFCYLTFRNLSGETHTALMDVMVVGETPMYDVRVRVVNLEMFRDFRDKGDNEGMMYKSSIERDFGNISVNYLNLRDWTSLGNYPIHTFNITWNARNGNYLQLYRIRLVGDRWSHRTQVWDTARNIRHDHHDDDYPVELDTNFFKASALTTG
jgi:hypothetical protein